MRDYTKKPKQENKLSGLEKKISTLTDQLKKALEKITKLELLVLSMSKKKTNDKPWLFDVEHDSDGRIKHVIAHKEGSSSRVLQ